MIIIKSFQVLDGDCIVLKYGIDKLSTVIVDVGYYRTFKDTIKKTLHELQFDAKNVELLIITHTDQDHCSGMKGFASNDDYVKMINQAWMNIPENLFTTPQNDNISYKDGNKSYSIFKKFNIPVLTNIHTGIETKSVADASFTFLSPTQADLEINNDTWLKTDYITANKNDWNKNLEDLYSMPEKVDTSITNTGSIAFLFEYQNKKILLLGDSLPSVVEAKLNSMGYNENNPLAVDLVKISHHGSDRNTSTSFLKCLSCENYLISGNGRHLSKASIAKILYAQKGRKEINFYFNYPQEEYHGLFNAKDNTFPFKCHYSEKSNNYIELLF